jgi:peptide/nickel transport system permease protein
MVAASLPAASRPAPARGAITGALARVLRLPRPLLAGAAILAPFLYLAVLPGTVAPYSSTLTVGVPLAAPSASDLLGTDEIGRDVLSRVIYGAQSDVLVSLAATALAFVVGSLVGVAIGYRGGLVDTASSRVIDIFLAFPAIVLALFLIAIFGHGEFVEIAAIAAVMAPSMARFARSTSVLLRHRAFVESSQILRASSWYVMRRHLLPNALRTMLVAASVLGASAVLIAASLSYLGLGAQPPTASWGEMLYNAFNNVFQAPLYGVVPGACITVLAYGYLLMARGLGELQGRTGQHSDSAFRSSVTRV